MRQRRPMMWDGKRLKALRDAFDMTQLEFAKHLGVTLRTLAGWETKRSIPRVVANLLDRIEKEAPRELAAAS